MINRTHSEHPSIQFQVLSDQGCHEIFEAALECLQRVGVEVRHAEGRALLAKAGAAVKDKIVTIPSEIIRGATCAAPRSFHLWGWDHQKSIEVAPDKVHFGPGPPPKCAMLCQTLIL